MQTTVLPYLPIFLFAACVTGLAVGLLIVANIFNPVRPNRVKSMPYESGMDPFHDTHRRFDIRFYLLAIAFLVFDVELLFLYPWAVSVRPAAETAPPTTITATQAAAQPLTTEPLQKTVVLPQKSRNENRNTIFLGAMLFIVLLSLGYVYDWRKGVFDWK
jgi:NADH-quinone oxidoreductase subunit A